MIKLTSIRFTLLNKFKLFTLKRWTIKFKFPFVHYQLINSSSVVNTLRHTLWANHWVLLGSEHLESRSRWAALRLRSLRWRRRWQTVFFGPTMVRGGHIGEGGPRSRGGGQLDPADRAAGCFSGGRTFEFTRTVRSENVLLLCVHLCVNGPSHSQAVLPLVERASSISAIRWLHQLLAASSAVSHVTSHLPRSGEWKVDGTEILLSSDNLYLNIFKFGPLKTAADFF